MPKTALRQLLPEPAELPVTDDEQQLVDLYDSGQFGPTHTIRDGVRVQSNMVMSFDGAVAGADFTSRTVSTPADMRVFSVLRSLADVVITGAGTARAEELTRLSPKPAHAHQRTARGQREVPTLALVSGSGNVDPELVNSRGTSPVIVFTLTAEARTLERLRANFDEVVVLDSLAPAAIMRELITRGHRRILCEGGPTLLGQFVAHGWIDEMCLTISPKLLGMPARSAFPNLLGRQPLDEACGVRPLSLITDGETMMYRLRVAQSQ